MSEKITPISAPYWRGVSNENIKVTDVYETEPSESKTLSEFQSITKDIGQSVVSGIKGSKLTDLTNIVKSGSSLSVDKTALTARLEQVSGVRFGSKEGLISEMSTGSIAKMYAANGADSKRIMDSTGQWVNLSEGTSFSTAKDYTSLVSEIMGGDVGRVLVDNYAEAAFFGTMLSTAIAIGLPDAIDALVEKISDKKQARKALIDSLETAARNGDLVTLKKIRGYIGGAAMYSKLPNLIPLVLQGYRFPTTYDETITPNYKAIYDEFLDLFNSVNAKWITGTRVNQSCSKLVAFTTASADSITVFTNYGDYITEALIATKYPADSISNLARKQFTYTYLAS